MEKIVNNGLDVSCLQYRLTDDERTQFNEHGYFAVENALSPEQVAQATALTDRILEVRGPEERARTQESIPVKRYGTPEDVAATILYVASDDAAYLNGQTISVNGGRFMT